MEPKRNRQEPASPTIDGILAHNRTFVERREFERYATDKYPDKKLAIVSCMDTRLTALLLAALGLKNGDAKIIKVAGAEVAAPLRQRDALALDRGVRAGRGRHHDRGPYELRRAAMSGKEMVASMERLGVTPERIELARHCGIDFDRWLAGFGDTEEAVRKSVDMVRNHPVMPPARARAGLRHGLRHRPARPCGLLSWNRRDAWRRKRKDACITQGRIEFGRSGKQPVSSSKLPLPLRLQSVGHVVERASLKPSL